MSAQWQPLPGGLNHDWWRQTQGIARRRRKINPSAVGNVGAMRHSISQNANAARVVRSHAHMFVTPGVHVAPTFFNVFRWQRAHRNWAGAIIAKTANAVIANLKTFLIGFARSFAAPKSRYVARISKR
jgi:hypothetical protein